MCTHKPPELSDWSEKWASRSTWSHTHTLCIAYTFCPARGLSAAPSPESKQEERMIKNKENTHNRGIGTCEANHQQQKRKQSDNGQSVHLPGVCAFFLAQAK